ncbi:MAG: SUKH-4 family immunity protein [Polyangiaceae bacterium]
MDSDLVDAVKALKAIFEKRFIPANFGKNDAETVDALKTKLGLPERYASFLKEADPLDVETVTPTERVRLVPASDLLSEQNGYGSSGNGESAMPGWRDGWVLIGHSGMLGDPYFLDTNALDAEGDCPVLTAMTGTDRLEPVMCASSFATFVQILAIAMEVAEDFPDDAMDPDEEQIFREALAPRLRSVDPAAVREGHWTS